MEVVSEEQAWASLFYAFLFALVTYFIARRVGYFRLPPESKASPVTLKQTIGIFLIYLLLALLILPLLNLGLVRFINHGSMTKEWLGWAQVGALAIVFLALLSYCLLIPPSTRHYIFWGDMKASLKRFYKAIGMGGVSLIVSYPFVLFISAVTNLISLWIWKEAKVEQVAVEQLKMTMGRPALFAVMIVMVVLIVPFMEELLFRGFLQSFLKRYLGRFWGLVVTAILFAFAHFAPSQGTGNFQLITSLFVLALFLGFVYERERTLWASITLHATFNCSSVFLMML